MDFMTFGGVEGKRGSFCAHVQWSDKGVNRHIRGPCRPDQAAAQTDLDTMRCSASGMGREEGYEAMEAEAVLSRQISLKAAPSGRLTKSKSVWKLTCPDR